MYLDYLQSNEQQISNEIKRMVVFVLIMFNALQTTVYSVILMQLSYALDVLASK